MGGSDSHENDELGELDPGLVCFVGPATFILPLPTRARGYALCILVLCSSVPYLLIAGRDLFAYLIEALLDPRGENDHAQMNKSKESYLTDLEDAFFEKSQGGKKIYNLENQH